MNLDVIVVEFLDVGKVWMEDKIVDGTDWLAIDRDCVFAVVADDFRFWLDWRLREPFAIDFAKVDFARNAFFFVKKVFVEFKRKVVFAVRKIFCEYLQIQAVFRRLQCRCRKRAGIELLAAPERKHSDIVICVKCIEVVPFGVFA